MMFWRMMKLVYLKRLLALLMVAALASCSAGGGSGVTLNTDGNPVINALGLSWTVPATREDGTTAMSLSEIEIFRIYYGTDSGDYQRQIDISDSSADQVQIENFPPGTYFVVVTVVDTAGRESLFSDEVMITI